MVTFEMKDDSLDFSFTKDEIKIISDNIKQLDDYDYTDDDFFYAIGSTIPDSTNIEDVNLDEVFNESVPFSLIGSGIGELGIKDLDFSKSDSNTVEIPLPNISLTKILKKEKIDKRIKIGKRIWDNLGPKLKKLICEKFNYCKQTEQYEEHLDTLIAGIIPLIIGAIAVTGGLALFVTFIANVLYKLFKVKLDNFCNCED